jgi:hypothetical protein
VAVGVKLYRPLAELVGDITGSVVVGDREELLRGVGEEGLPFRIDRLELAQILDEQPEIRPIAAHDGDGVLDTGHASGCLPMIAVSAVQYSPACSTIARPSPGSENTRKRQHAGTSPVAVASTKLGEAVGGLKPFHRDVSPDRVL